MSKIIKDIKVTWTWEGDSYAIKGFNIAITPSGDTPHDNIVVFARAGNVRSYIFRDVTLDDTKQYTAWVQAIYENSDSDWVSASGIVVQDDGNATIETKNGAQEKADQAEQNAKDASLLKGDYLTPGQTTIDGGKITANSITAEKVNFTVVGTDNIIGTINASIEGIKISGSHIIINGETIFETNSDGASYDVTTYLTPGTTTIDGSKITTGTLSASKITSGTLDASRVSVVNLNASNITSGTLDASSVNVINLNASNINTGFLNADRISGGTLDISRVTIKATGSSGYVEANQNGIYAYNSSGVAQAGFDIAGRFVAGGGQIIADASGFRAANGNFTIDSTGKVTINMSNNIPAYQISNLGAMSINSATDHLFHFDRTLQSTQGLKPLDGYVATLRPGEGKFGGAVAVEEGTTNIATATILPYTPYHTMERNGQNLTFQIKQDNRYLVIEIDGFSVSGKTLAVSGYMKKNGSPYIFTSPQISTYNSLSNNKKKYFNANTGYFEVVEEYNESANWIIHARLDAQIGDIITIENFQVEQKPFATSFVDGTRAAGVLRYPQLLDKKRGTLSVWINPHVVANWNNFFSMSLSTGRFLLFFHANGMSSWDFGPTNTGPTAPAGTVAAGRWTMHTLTWDADAGVYRYYVNGKFIGKQQYVEPDSLPSALPTVINRGALLDELLILPYAATDAEIKTWYGMGTPFYDGTEIDTYQTEVGVVENGPKGIKMTPQGYPQRSMHLDGAQLAFWDKNNMPSIALGDLTQARQNIINAGMTNLFPDGFTDESNFPQYGFLMMQGNIALAKSVLAHSLVTIPGTLLEDEGVVNKKLAKDSVTNYNVAPNAISLDKLADNISVPNVDSISVLRLRDTTVYQGSSSVKVWSTIATIPFNRKSGDYFAEVLRFAITSYASKSGSYLPRMRVLFDGEVILEADVPYTSRTVEVSLDVRKYPIEGTSLVIQQFTYDTKYRVIVTLVEIYQNQQYPLRLGVPVYGFNISPSGCFTRCEASCESSCEASCQGGCEVSCESSCQKSCESSCQSSCQSTCEKTSQSGGRGCIREGTPVDVWDLEEQDYITVPVEDLKPGMILPWYQPETDTVIHGELLELRDASYSNEFLRIRTHNGPPVDVTFSQPFDVLADLGQGKKWYKLQAMYLRPGMQLVRPFEAPNNRLSTIVSVETVREPGVHFWNPKTSAGGFCVNGYADAIIK